MPLRTSQINRSLFVGRKPGGKRKTIFFYKETTKLLVKLDSDPCVAQVLWNDRYTI
jgi:hypothetical protein